MRRNLVHASQCCPHSSVGESGKPPGASVFNIGNVQTQSVDEQRGNSLLGDQGAAGLRIPHLAHNAFHSPPCRTPRRFVGKDHNRRQYVEQEGSCSFQVEMTAEKKEVISWIDREYAVMPFALRDQLACIDGWNGEVACEYKRKAVRKQQAGAFAQRNSCIDALHGKPTLTRDDRIALDALVRGKLKRLRGSGGKCTGHVPARLQH